MCQFRPLFARSRHSNLNLPVAAPLGVALTIGHTAPEGRGTNRYWYAYCSKYEGSFCVGYRYTSFLRRLEEK